MAVLIALAIVFLRYWILPDIEQYHDKITASVSEAIGSTVTISNIESDWQGLHPRLSFTDVRILDEQRQPALVLPRIDSSVSWMSLFTAELRLSSLEISKPELLIRRDLQGRIFIGGLLLSKQGGNNDISDWLLHQSHMVVRDALLVWVDEQREAPPLVLQKVNLRVDSYFSQHSFALRALPPGYLATPLDIRGRFHGASFDDLSQWYGQLFTQIDYADVMAWRSWLDLPKEFSQGRGGLRAWMDVEAGNVSGIIADMKLYNVAAVLAEDVPEMILDKLHGRAEWKVVAGGIEVSTHKLAMRFQDGFELQPMDAYFRATKADNDKPAAGEVRVNLMKLEKIASLANYFPLEEELRNQLKAYSPKGRVANLDVQWQGAIEKPVSFNIRGQFEEIALNRVGSMPGFTGLSLDVDGSNEGGRLNVNTHQLVVDAPGIMREPLSFATLIGQAGWQRENNELRFTLDNIIAVNDDLSGNLYGSYQTQAGTFGVLDLTANLTRGDIKHAARYIPLAALNKDVNDWLSGALLAGHTEDLSIRIKGNLSDFPLDNSKDVVFLIGGHMQDASLAFAENWPIIENINGEFSMHGNKLEVISPSATMSGAHLQNVTVTLPDVTSDDLALEINGEAVAGNDTFLQFIQQSPVRGYLGGFTDGVRANGDGHLTLFVNVPLKGDKPVQVSGNYMVQQSDIDLGEGVPWLRKTSGVLAFTESGIQANGVSAGMLGGAARINMQTAEKGALHVTVQGHCNAEAWSKTNPHPLLNYLHGATAWDADIVVANKSVQLVIKSNLDGVSSTLPQPFTKLANELMPLRVEKKPVLNSTEGNIEEGKDLITAQLGGLFNAQIERHDKKGAMTIKRGTVDFGGQGKLAGTSKKKKRSSGHRRYRNGIWLTGRLPELSIQGWDSLIRSSGKSSLVLPISGINMQIKKLTGYGKTIESLRVKASKRGDGLAAQLASSKINGEVVWLPRGYEKGGKLSARLRNLYLEKDEQPAQVSQWANPSDAGLHANAETIRPGKLPALEMVIEDLQVNKKQFGRFELVGHPEGRDWQMRRLNITNPDGSLAGDGVWSSSKRETQTQVNLQLKLSNVGNTLARSGYPNTVKDGSGKLKASLSWDGTPDEFNYASLSGTLNLDTGKGRFLQMEPGAGKLLSILSLQALPSHITLDFNDVFSKGFQFDKIRGNAAIKDGVINTQDLHIDGSAAKVTLEGSVNLNSETQDLRVRVLPTVGDSVSLISAFAAGPAVGVGTLIVSKILGDPLDKLVAFEYNVTGTWVGPNVVKVIRTQAPDSEE